jgi:hypothetical protein
MGTSDVYMIADAGIRSLMRINQLEKAREDTAVPGCSRKPSSALTRRVPVRTA